MLEKSIAFSGFAAGNLEKIKEFCTKTPGLKATEDHGLLTLHLAARSNRPVGEGKGC